MPPTLLQPDSLVALDYVGIGVFAVSGALVAAEKKQTLVTFIFLAVATGIGGGTLRDLLIGAPVFWVHHNASMVVCLGAALAVWFFSRPRAAEKALPWFDAVGLVAYSVYGTEKALRDWTWPFLRALIVPSGFETAEEGLRASAQLEAPDEEDAARVERWLRREAPGRRLRRARRWGDCTSDSWPQREISCGIDLSSSPAEEAAVPARPPLP